MCTKRICIFSLVLAEFIEDIELMFSNCFEYNPRNTNEAKAGTRLQAFFHIQAQKLGLPVASGYTDRAGPAIKKSRIWLLPSKRTLTRVNSIFSLKMKHLNHAAVKSNNICHTLEVWPALCSQFIKHSGECRKD